MTDLTTQTLIRKAQVTAPAIDQIVLDYDGRILRRKRLETQSGIGILVDLPATTSLEAGDCLALADGQLVEITAASEQVIEITGDLTRLAWHIGNRHTPCQILPDRLRIRDDHVLEHMLLHLGAKVEKTAAPFTPEGGAYGHGRTMGHSH